MTCQVICVLCNCYSDDCSNGTAYYFYNFESLNKILSSENTSENFANNVSYIATVNISDEDYAKYIEHNSKTSIVDHENEYWYYTNTHRERNDVDSPHKLFTKSLFINQFHWFGILGWGEGTMYKHIAQNYQLFSKKDDDCRLLFIYFLDRRFQEIPNSNKKWKYLVENKNKISEWCLDGNFIIGKNTFGLDSNSLSKLDLTEQI